MATYRIPDHIVCLGGGGTNLGKTFISQDWVLEEFVQQNPRDSAPDNSNDQLKTFFVDTDNSSLPSEDWITSQIGDPISSMEEEYDVVDPNIDVETINISEGTHEKYLRPAQVTSPSRIQTLADDQGIKAWWIDDDPDNRIIGRWMD
ncbi:hypothetical protein [Halonotius sp. GCM10025705]|uniref:hypothetical protein n=1 Tax=Halonotius sp. GCM10025705 TaxID=3252678 RepID=UPI0036D3D44D